MADSKFRIDPETQKRLGSQVLADLRANLWPVDCQTCGRPLGRWGKPSLEVRAQDGIATASLHHQRCRPPAWSDGTVATGGGGI
ncbi:hypothetical protein E1293_24015 [Actinomadura darangshiensis]|uniref:Uncharacterized protein n=1 Tax=Actinomadura darangshiensis TaxID=705336 RepID=A0A4R5B3V1_9ACTN|nr:hypothetical protein [Actinomadura darangshiensis]TDD79220.1 hypothetical protein E1293_24015 [Actinomadura darangshiensis]